MTSAVPIEANPSHYREGLATFRPGEGFFRPDSRPSRDLGVLLARSLARRGAPRVLDLMAGSGLRSLRYGLEGRAADVWANDADPDRLPLLQANLAALPPSVAVEATSLTAQRLLASLIAAGERRELIDLDAFGFPGDLLAAALACVSFGGVLYLASSDGRGATGHDRPAALRRYGAAARAHPAPWELALRLQLGAVARAAWTQGRGIRPLLAFSEGRTFRTAVRVERLPGPREEEWLGMLAHCHRCGEQQLRPMIRLGHWRACCHPADGPLAICGPLWIGPLQDPDLLGQLAEEAGASPPTLSPAAAGLLRRLRADPGLPARVWPTALIGRRLSQGPPPLRALVTRLQEAGHGAWVSGVMAGQVRSDAPWDAVLAAARALGAGAAAQPRSGPAA